MSCGPSQRDALLVVAAESRSDLSLLVPPGVSETRARYERVAHEAEEAAARAGERILAARRRRAAAKVRIAELRHDQLPPIHRPEEATARWVEAETAAKLSEKMALEEYERAVRAHDDAARTHERAAELIGSLGDSERASVHRRAAGRERVAADDARRVARAHASSVEDASG